MTFPGLKSRAAHFQNLPCKRTEWSHLQTSETSPLRSAWTSRPGRSAGGSAVRRRRATQNEAKLVKTNSRCLARCHN